MLLNTSLRSSPMTLRKNRTYQALCCVWHVCVCVRARLQHQHGKSERRDRRQAPSHHLASLGNCRLAPLVSNGFPGTLLDHCICKTICSVLSTCLCVSVHANTCVCVKERAWVHRCFCFLLVNPFFFFPLRCLMDNRCGKHANSTFLWTCK